ncbi:MAG: HAD family hydrolase [Synergistaceae bacterium]|jgi:phosphoglycolate phosphatase-like HAD superfamily hydrolase|nr:HAD family hydrolase [Synergistaceae bacterium]
MKREEQPWAHSGAEAISPDCIIFDVDGVLVDSKTSYQEVIRLIVEREWKKAGLNLDARGYSSELNDVFKNHGSFNDDYDIAWALLNIAFSSGSENLSEALPSPAKIGELFAPYSGECAGWMSKAARIRFDIAAVRIWGQELYTGAGDEPGRWTSDKPMLKSDWRSLPLPAYIYTGRDLTEWRLAQKTLSWQDFPDERTARIDMGIKKPSAEGLEYLCRKFGHERPVYFGDTAGDKLSYDEFGRGWFAAIGDIIQDAAVRFPDVETALRVMLNWDADTGV